jgi:uncharacterized protein (DUF2141 family)
MPDLPVFRESPFAPGTHRRAVRAGGQEVPYLLRIPPDHDPEYPTALVLLLDERPQEALRRSGWEKRADGSGFLAAATESRSPDALRAVYEDIRRRTRLDPARLFVAGRDCPAGAASLPEVAAVAGTSLEDLPKGIARLTLGTLKDAAVIWDFFDHNPRSTKPAIPTRLVVPITNLRTDRGNIPIALYRGAEGYGEPSRAHAADTVPIRGFGTDFRAAATFEKLPPGDYALVVLHDENGDGIMNTSFGFPQEGFGSSNNPRPKFGPPSFAETKFHIAGDTRERRIVVRLIYF